MLKYLSIAVLVVAPSMVFAASGGGLATQCVNMQQQSPQVQTVLDMAIRSVSLEMIEGFGSAHQKEVEGDFGPKILLLIEQLHSDQYKPFVLAAINNTETKFKEAVRDLGAETSTPINPLFQCEMYRAMSDVGSEPNKKIYSFLSDLQRFADSRREQLNARLKEMREE